MSDRIMKAVVELREFLYQNVYFNSAARDELRKTEKIIKDLFGYIMEHPDDYVRPYPAGDPVDRPGRGLHRRDDRPLRHGPLRADLPAQGLADPVGPGGNRMREPCESRRIIRPVMAAVLALLAAAACRPAPAGPYREAAVKTGTWVRGEREPEPGGNLLAGHPADSQVGQPRSLQRDAGDRSLLPSGLPLDGRSGLSRGRPRRRRRPPGEDARRQGAGSL